MDGQTIPGKISQCGGGVGRNIADALGKLQINPFFISAVGEEEIGEFILNKTVSHLKSNGIAKHADSSSGTCMVLCDHNGECLFAVGDMEIHGKITSEHVEKHENTIANSSLVVFDANIPPDTMKFILDMCHKNSIPVWFEPTDIFRATKPFSNNITHMPNFISPNFREFIKIYEAIFQNKNEKTNNALSDPIDECVKKGYEMANLIDNIIITLGEKGVLIIRKGEAEDPFFTASAFPKYLKPTGPISHRLYQPRLIDKEEIINVSGAGDCFASGFMSAMLKGKSEKACVELGFKCSTASLLCSKTVPTEFS